MNNFMAGILKDVQIQTEKAQAIPFWGCDNCGLVVQQQDPGATCKHCFTGRLYKGETKELARSIAQKAKDLKAQTDTAPEVTEVNPVDAEKARIAKEKSDIQAQLMERGIAFSSRMGIKKLKELLTAPAIVEEVTPTPEPTKEEPVIEQEPVIETEVETEEVKAEAQAPASTAQVDYQAIRKAAINAFVTKNNIDEFTPTPVGTAVVQSHGITVWNDKMPTFRLQQPFESGADFGAVYDKLRASHPTCKVDIVQCNNASNPELMKCLYNGDLLAGLNNGNGTHVARVGETVSIGALRTNRGHLRFVVLEVIR